MSESIKILEPEGIIDHAGGERLIAAVNSALKTNIDVILIDFRNITFMDSSGLGAMISILKQVRGQNVNLVLCSINDQVQILMEMTRMDQVFDILPDRAAFIQLMQN